MRLLRPPARAGVPTFSAAGCWEGHHLSEGFAPGARTGRGGGAWVWSRDPAPRKTATCVAANQDPARVHLAVNPEVCGGSYGRPVRKGGGIWQLGLLAGATAGAAEVVAAPASARSLLQRCGVRSLRGCGPKRAEHGARIGPDPAGPRRSGSGTKLCPPVALTSTDLCPGLGLVPTSLPMLELHLYLFFCLDLALSSLFWAYFPL